MRRRCSLSILFALNVLVDRLGGNLARAHGEDDGRCARDGVAARIHALKAGLAVLVRDDLAAALRLQSRRRLL